MKSLSKLIAGLVCAGCVGWAAVRIHESQTSVESDPIVFKPPFELPPIDRTVFNPFQVVPPFAPITEAPVVTGHEIGDFVTDEELVLGVTVKGESRAYPINMLTGPQREIINDRLGGVAIAATW